MLREARSDRGDLGASCLLALLGRPHPTPEEAAGAGLLAHALHDLHVLARGLNLKE